MKVFTGRREVLVAGTAAIAFAAGAAAEQPNGIGGIVDYEGGKPIPQGQLQIFLDDPAQKEQRAAVAPTVIESGGKLTEVEFSVQPDSQRSISSPVQIVAQLLRKDGWLLARGSTDFTPDAPMRITLYTVMY